MRVEPAGHFFWLLCSADSGDFLRHELILGTRADDAACWELSADGRSATAPTAGVESELLLEIEDAASANSHLSYNPVGEQGRLCTVRVRNHGGEALPGQYLLVRGPSELPSVSLAQMRAVGFCVLPQIVHPDTVADMKRTFYSEGFYSRIRDLVDSTPSVSKTAVHPVMLWLCEEYIQGPIHVGMHPPPELRLCLYIERLLLFSGRRLQRRDHTTGPARCTIRLWLRPRARRVAL